MYNCLNSALYRANPRCALFLVRPLYSPGVAEFAHSDLFKIIETGRVMTPFKSSVVHVEFILLQKSVILGYYCIISKLLKRFWIMIIV